MSAWWHDFSWSLQGVTVKATGAKISFSRDILRDVSRGLPYIARQTLDSLTQHPHYAIAVLPSPPRAWYLMWAAVKAGGGRFTTDISAADAVAFFDDQTLSQPPQDIASAKPQINFACRDISKSHVAEVFERVFGYPLRVDPTVHVGPMVVKGEDNGVHDGRIEIGPIKTPLPDTAYQIAVNNTDEDDVIDLRCPTVGGIVPLIYIKRRPTARRFDNMNATVTLARTQDHLSQAEQAKISEFSTHMGLDWGGLDILRDKESGKIYIVDVNKTDMGPPLALPMRDKRRSAKIMGEALANFIVAKTTAPKERQV